jgi:hypothetical protein
MLSCFFLDKQRQEKKYSKFKLSFFLRETKKLLAPVKAIQSKSNGLKAIPHRAERKTERDCCNGAFVRVAKFRECERMCGDLKSVGCCVIGFE